MPTSKTRSKSRSKTPAKRRRSRSASPCAKKGTLIRRKSYTRKDGVHVRATSYCQKDRGTVGKQSRGSKDGPHSKDAKWIQRAGKLQGKGYLSKTAAERHKILDKCVAKWGYASCRGSVQVLNRNSAVKAKHGAKISADVAYLVKKFGSGK